MNKMLRTYQVLVKMVVAAAVALTVQCCTLVYEWPEENDVEVSANLRITLNVPATKAPAGDEASGFDYDDRNLHEGSDNTLMLGDLNFYFFDLQGRFAAQASGFEFVKLTPEPYDATPSKKFHRYSADIKVDGVVNNRDYRVVVIANRMQDQHGHIPFCVPNTPNPVSPDSSISDEQYLYSQLVFDTCNPGGTVNTYLYDYTRWNLEAFDYARVPMWGVQEMKLKIQLDNGAELESSGDINLLRSIAKVRISLSKELKKTVKITDYVQGNNNTGVVLNYSRPEGYMTPSYSVASVQPTTWNSSGKDKDGSIYTDLYVNTTSQKGSFTAPFFKDSEDGCYYIYLPEQKIGDAFVSLQFQYTDPNFITPVKVNKTLQFADYDAAVDARGPSYGDLPLTENQLKSFRFPVMRNHYYIYEIRKLDPLELKYEICDWSERVAPDIIFN